MNLGSHTCWASVLPLSRYPAWSCFHTRRMPSAFSHVPLTHRSTRGQTQKLTLEESPGGFGGWASTGQLEYLCQCEWGGCLSISWALFLEFCVWLAYIGLQEAIFNKSTGKVILKTFSLYKKLLTLLRAGHDQGKSR